MEWTQNYYNELIQKLDQFTRKYYINKLIRGSLYFVGLMTLLFVAFNLLENQFYFSRDVRKFLFISFILTSGYTLFQWVFNPLMHYFRLGQMISHQEAAKIIGTHFSNVQDKLLNVLQLKTQAVNYTDRTLIDASIQQKANELHPVPFLSAIDYNKNKKYVRYALIPLSLLFGILLVAPSMIRDSTKRIIENNTEFKKAALFSFSIKEKDLLVPQGEDFKLLVEHSGSVIPNEAFIEIDQMQYRLKKENDSQFSYVFNNVQQATTFKIVSGNIQSDNYQLKVALNPVLIKLQAKLDYPDYTGMKDETLQNSGDMSVPVGTKISWTLEADHTAGLFYSLGNSRIKNSMQQRGENIFQFSVRAMKDDPYVVYLKNSYFTSFDSVQYLLSTIPDQYPQINVQTFEDSTDNTIIYLTGDASDDYGLNDLKFNYQIITKNDKNPTVISTKINLTASKS
ncbi:MAG: DUF4175 family protein, partial [Saprospiraceae bacterium]